MSSAVAVDGECVVVLAEGAGGRGEAEEAVVGALCVYLGEDGYEE